jgi:hypothetical protein
LFYLQVGGYLRFQGLLKGTIDPRMGISFISTEQACPNAENVLGEGESGWGMGVEDRPASMSRGEGGYVKGLAEKSHGWIRNDNDLYVQGECSFRRSSTTADANPSICRPSCVALG